MKKKTTVNITIDSNEDYTNRFNEDKLSDSLSNYIYEECKGEPLSNSVLIKIKLNYKSTEEEQDKISRMIRKNYRTEVKENLIQFKHSLLSKSLLFFIGIIFLVISYFDENANSFIVSEIALIIGWLSIGEAISTYIFEAGKINTKVKRLKQLSKCQIDFEQFEV